MVHFEFGQNYQMDEKSGLHLGQMIEVTQGNVILARIIPADWGFRVHSRFLNQNSVKLGQVRMLLANGILEVNLLLAKKLEAGG